jgi:hypothetical protein
VGEDGDFADDTLSPAPAAVEPVVVPAASPAEEAASPPAGKAHHHHRKHATKGTSKENVDSS